MHIGITNVEAKEKVKCGTSIDGKKRYDSVWIYYLQIYTSFVQFYKERDIISLQRVVRYNSYYHKLDYTFYEMYISLY